MCTKWCEAAFRRIGVSSWPYAQATVTSQMYTFRPIVRDFDQANTQICILCDLKIKLEIHSYDFANGSLFIWRCFEGDNWPWSFQMVSSWCSTLSQTLSQAKEKFSLSTWIWSKLYHRFRISHSESLLYMFST